MTFDMLKDGNQTIVVLHGPSVAVDELVFRILNAAMLEPEEARKEAEKYPEPPAEAEVEKIEGLKPVAETVYLVPSEEQHAQIQKYNEFRKRNRLTIDEVPYKEMTPDAILRKDNERGLVWLRKYIKQHKDASVELKEDIVRSCRRYMLDATNDVALLDSRARKLNFIKTLCDEYGIPDHDGYRNYREFSEYASDEEISQKAVSVAEYIALYARKTQQNT